MSNLPASATHHGRVSSTAVPNESATLSTYWLSYSEIARRATNIAEINRQAHFLLGAEKFRFEKNGWHVWKNANNLVWIEVLYSSLHTVVVLACLLAMCSVLTVLLNSKSKTFGHPWF